MRPRPFEVTLHATGALCVIAVRGEIDGANVERLADAIQDAAGMGNVHVDLAQADFVGAAALAAFVEGAMQAKNHGADFTLTNCSPFVRRLLEICRLSHLAE